ncbi:unnamed protein product [Pedinophyceae sp. YPF-701]|nr:unnamed protein product [Pedinophyceae sp. YPF-701]
MHLRDPASDGFIGTQVSLSLDATVADLQQQIQESHDLLARQQKVISSGKTLSAKPSQTLRAAGLKDGAKVMIMATAGTHAAAQTAGKRMAQSAADAKKAEEAKRRIEAIRAGRDPDAVRGDIDAQPKKPPVSSLPQRVPTWAATGIVGLRELALAELPEVCLQVGARARVLDLGRNRLAGLPTSIGALSGLLRLNLGHNQVTARGVGPALAAVPLLEVLYLNDNKLSEVPGEIGSLKHLTKLNLSNNEIAGGVEALAACTALDTLSLASNKLAAIPPELAACTALKDMELPRNRIREIPVELAALQQLQILDLHNNLVETVPAAVFRGCVALHTLSLHGNPITVDKLRELDGFAEMEARRRSKVDKQIDRRVMLNTGQFDEGADFQRWVRPNKDGKKFGDVE